MKNYFSHDEGARNDPKLVRVLMRLGQAGKGVYWDLVEMLHEQGGYLPVDDLESLAYGLRTDLPLLTSLLNDFGLFSQDAERFWSETALKRLQLRNAKAEARAQAGAKGGKAKAEREAAAKALLEQEASIASQDSSNATALPTETLASKGKERKEEQPTPISAAPLSAEVDGPGPEVEPPALTVQAGGQPQPGKKARLLVVDENRALGFAAFWQAYHGELPKRAAKGKTAAKWNKLPEAIRQRIMDGLEVYRADATRNGPDYLPYATTFLNEARYESEDYGRRPASTKLAPVAVATAFPDEPISLWGETITAEPQVRYQATQPTGAATNLPTAHARR